MSKSNHEREKIYINEWIKAFNILLLDEGWEKQGVVSRADALKKAKDLWLDLVQVWYNWKDKISICKIVDYWKYQYQLKKKEKEKKKTQKSKWLKEIKLSYWIEENDLKLKVEKAKELLQKWYWIRFILRLKWRENIFKEQAREKLQYIIEILKDYWKSTWIKEEWKWLSLVLFAKLK